MVEERKEELAPSSCWTTRCATTTGNYYMVNEDSLARMHAVRASIYDVRVLWREDRGKVEEVREGV